MKKTKTPLDALAESMATALWEYADGDIAYRMTNSDRFIPYCQKILRRELESASSQRVNAELPAVRSTAWLDAIQPMLEALEHHEEATPKTEAWQRDGVKVEVRLGDLRKLREIASNGRAQPR